MRVILTGGGTAGHVNPAIAIAEIIKENISDSQIFFVGTEKGMENRLVGQKGYPIYHAKAMGIDRSLTPKNLYAMWLAFYSPIKTRKLIKKLSPDIVIGTGGYVCWPVIKAAAACGVPTLIHESNALPGLTVRMLEECVSGVLLNFADSAKRLKHPEKAVVTGNPMRVGFSTVDRESARRELGLSNDDKLILSFGGSLGAVALNNACVEMMADYVQKTENIYHIHATGENNYDACKEKLDALVSAPTDRIRLERYIHNMPTLMSAADVVISRAGAMTVSELSLVGRASILVPYPHATDGHQLKNAQVLADGEAAILVEEKNLAASVLTNHVKNVIEDNELRNKMERNVKNYAFPDANRRVYEEIMKLVRK